MQRWTTLVALAFISLLSAAPAQAFHHGRRGCCYGGCYAYCGPCYGGGCYAGYGYGGPYAYGGGYPAYGYYGGYPTYARVSPMYTPAYSGVAYSAPRAPVTSAVVAPSYYVAPGYNVANRGYSPIRPFTAPVATPASATTAAPRVATPATNVARPATGTTAAVLRPIGNR